MKKQWFLATVVLLSIIVFQQNSTHAIECIKPPQQFNKDLEAEVDAAVAKVLSAKGYELKAKAKMAAQDLLGRLPNADKVYIEQMMYFSYCTALRDDKAVSDTEKAKMIREYNREVREVIKKNNPSMSQQLKKRSDKNTAKKQVDDGQSISHQAKLVARPSTNIPPSVSSAPSPSPGLTPSTTSESFGANVRILHKGQIDISVIDSKGNLQKLEEVYVSCAKEERKVKANGRTEISVPINDCKQLSVNCQLVNSTRWLSDVWHEENRGLPLILTEYTVIVNGSRLDHSSVKREDNHANYVGLLVRQ